MFEPLQKFMPKAAAKYGVKREIEAARVCQVFRKVLLEVFDNMEGIQDYILPAFFKEGVMVVNVKSQAWAQEIIIRKSKIIYKLNEKLEDDLVKNIRTKMDYTVFT